MKKFLSMLLILCLFLGALPAQALAYVADNIQRADTVEQVSVGNSSLVLQNDYIRITLNKQDGSLTTSPAATSSSVNQTDKQKPFCEFVTWKGYGYNKQELVYPSTLRLKNVSFVNKTPNGDAKAIKVEYDLTTKLPDSTLTATTAVYYELVQCKEDESSEDTWGVLTTVSSIYITGGYVPPTTDSDAYMPRWGYTLDDFTGMGHANATDSPAIKMRRTVYNTDQHTESTESSVLTSKVENLSTWDAFFQGSDYCGVDIRDVYVDGYTWANPFVGLTQASDVQGIDIILPERFSVTPDSSPANTYVECKGDVAYHFDSNEPGGNVHFLWGFRELKKGVENVPTEADKVEISIEAKRLAAFANGDSVTVEYVADDAALNALKQQYGDPIALISGDYESRNGTEFTFTGGAALLSPSVTATWDTSNKNNKLVIHKDGTITHSGLSLNAPSFKFYQPKSGAGKDLKIKLTQDGFTFDINPTKNEAVIYVDIPYANAKLEKAVADAAGNLVFSGDISFQTIFEGASFTLEELGYGLNEKNEFKVNGVHATGSFDTAKTLSLELASVEGEVNTFKGKEKYAFNLELNAFDLFETEAELELTRSKQDGSLLPNTLYFYVASSPGIPLIPPVPIGQLNGGGAGFSNLADTVNGDYFAIPPLKLRGTLKGTYLHLIEGKGNVVIGPSEISLTASEVGIVGTNASIIDSFGYALKLNGQERTYKGTTYKGIYFVGSEALNLHLPNTAFNVIVLNSSVELGAFGGTDENKTNLYLGVGANGSVRGRVQFPDNIRVLGGLGVDVANINLVIGGQTIFPIRNASVSEGMKQAFSNMDVYLGAMTEVGGWLASARAWVLLPNIVETNFRMGGGWDIEVNAFGYLPEWDWSDKGIDPIVQAMSSEDSGEAVPMLLAEESGVPVASGENTEEITVTAGADETPYILLAFENTVTEQEIKDALKIQKDNQEISVNWVGEDGLIDADADINADIDIIHNTTDNKDYSVALLRLNEGGIYTVNTGSLELKKHQEAAVTPFEELDLSLNNQQVTGQIKYAETDTKYVLRTYFANEEGGADYLIDEQEVTDASNISVEIPQSGALAPTGSYYVTSFLMTEKSVESTNENGEVETLTGLVAIDNQQFDTQVSYTNNNHPIAPDNVALNLAGNEVMTASWGKVDSADGYAVTIYQKQDDGTYKDTGFGYDLDKNATSINMALTVGGQAVEVNEEGEISSTTAAENLEANKTYKVGVRAYRTIEGGKYYSTEVESSEQYLPQYTPLNLMLSMNDTPCIADENGVYHAYVDGTDDVLTVNCETTGVTYKVTRMDTNAEIRENTAGSGYMLPDFEGSLMFRIDGISGVAGNTTAKDMTSVFLLVSVDKTPPVLTLSAPIFYADKMTGEYQITGTADAGSKIFYGNDGKSVDAANDGSFTVPGTLESNGGVLSLYAQDSAGNESALQLALITKQPQYAVTVNGSYTQDSGDGEYSEGETITIKAGERSGYQFGGWTSNRDVAFADASSATTTFTMPNADVTVTANWKKSVSPTPITPGDTVKYIVEHYKASNDGYTLEETEYLGGAIGSNVTAEPKTYTGYTYNPDAEGSITKGTLKKISSASDILTLKLYYDLTVYAVTVENDGNGSATAVPGSATMGETISLTATPDSGYHFKSWEVVSGDVTISEDKFTMPAGNVTVKALFERKSNNDEGTTYYTLTFDTNGGSSIHAIRTTSGKTINLSDYIPTRNGYDFTGWYSDKTLMQKITEIKLNENKTVYAGWTKLTSDGSSTQKPPTGDSNELLLWSVLLLISGFSIINIVLLVKKKKGAK